MCFGVEIMEQHEQTWEEEPRPLEETDPVLARLLLGVVRGEHPVRSIVFGVHGRFYRKRDGQVINNPTERNEVCPCGSGKKYKRCCWALQ